MEPTQIVSISVYSFIQEHISSQIDDKNIFFRGNHNENIW